MNKGNDAFKTAECKALYDLIKKLVERIIELEDELDAAKRNPGKIETILAEYREKAPEGRIVTTEFKKAFGQSLGKWTGNALVAGVAATIGAVEAAGPDPEMLLDSLGTLIDSIWDKVASTPSLTDEAGPETTGNTWA